MRLLAYLLAGRQEEKMSDLTDTPTYELIEELKRREGVEFVVLSPYAKATVPAEGPAVVLVVTD